MRGRRISAGGVVKGSLTLDGANAGAGRSIPDRRGGSGAQWPRRARTFELNGK